MTDYPTDLRYSDKHTWVRGAGTNVALGVTSFAADRLGTISFMDMPFPGELFKPGELLGRMGSDEASTAIYMPQFTGQITAVNPALKTSPDLINSDPYGEGWLVQMEVGDPAAIESLIDAAGYEALLSANVE